MLMTVIGAGIVLLALADFIETTLSVRGAGFLTNQVTRWLWRPMGLWRRLPSRLAAAAGPVALICALMVWLLLTWSGWLLILSSHETAVVEATTKRAATLVERIYFVGYTLSTLGVGDFVPGNDRTRVLSILAAFNGFIVITLSITYFLSVVNSVTQSHALAREIHSLGRTGEEVVAHAWNGGDFSVLSERLTAFASKLFSSAEQRRSFPITNYFASHGDSSLAAAIAVLEDAVLLLEAGVAQQVRPHGAILNPAKKAIDAVIPDLAGPSDRNLPLPSREILMRSGIPLSDERSYLAAAREREAIRRAIHGWLDHQGRTTS